MQHMQAAYGKMKDVVRRLKQQLVKKRKEASDTQAVLRMEAALAQEELKLMAAELALQARVTESKLQSEKDAATRMEERAVLKRKEVGVLARAVEATKEEIERGKAQYTKMKTNAREEKSKAWEVINTAKQAEAKLQLQLEFLAQEQSRMALAKTEREQQDVLVMLGLNTDICPSEELAN